MAQSERMDGKPHGDKRRGNWEFYCLEIRISIWVLRWAFKRVFVEIVICPRVKREVRFTIAFLLLQNGRNLSRQIS